MKNILHIIMIQDDSCFGLIENALDNTGPVFMDPYFKLARFKIDLFDIVKYSIKNQLVI